MKKTGDAPVRSVVGWLRGWVLLKAAPRTDYFLIEAATKEYARVDCWFNYRIR